MQITIGIRESNRELALDVDITADALAALVADACESGTPLRLEDKDGKVAIVPASSLAYVEVASAENRRVGFGL